MATVNQIKLIFLPFFPSFSLQSLLLCLSHLPRTLNIIDFLMQTIFLAHLLISIPTVLVQILTCAVNLTLGGVRLGGAAVT